MNYLHIGRLHDLARAAPDVAAVICDELESKHHLSGKFLSTREGGCGDGIYEDSTFKAVVFPSSNAAVLISLTMPTADIRMDTGSLGQARRC